MASSNVNNEFVKTSNRMINSPQIQQLPVPIRPKPLPAHGLSPVLNVESNRLLKRPRQDYNYHTFSKDFTTVNQASQFHHVNPTLSPAVSCPKSGATERGSATLATKSIPSTTTTINNLIIENNNSHNSTPNNCTTNNCNNNNNNNSKNHNNINPKNSKNAYSQPVSSNRRRSPTLERLPRWMFPPVRKFLSSQAGVPLPLKVAVCGKPFYDWDAWALALLHPFLWRSRGPWERLIRGCQALNTTNSPLSVIKASLIRIIVAEVVSMLVCRSGDLLTPEDRNWITSVASRQKSHARKPTLCSILDFAFPMFQLSSFARILHPPVPHLSSSSTLNVRQTDTVYSIHNRIVELLNTDIRKYNNHRISSSFSIGLAKKNTTVDNDNSLHEFTVAMDPIVVVVMNLIGEQKIPNTDKKENQTIGLSTTECIQSIFITLQLIVESLPLPCSVNPQSSPTTSLKKSDDCRLNGKSIHQNISLLDHAVNAFVTSLSHLSDNLKSSSTKLSDKDKVSIWLGDAMRIENWSSWSQLAHDISYVFRSTDSTKQEVMKNHTQLCEKIIIRLFDISNEEETANQSCASSDDTNSEMMTTGTHSVGQKVSNKIVNKDCFGHRQVSQLEPTIRLVLDLATAFDQFVTAFIESNFSSGDTISSLIHSHFQEGDEINFSNPRRAIIDSKDHEKRQIHRMVEEYENLISELSLLRSVLLGCGEKREMAMVGWSDRGLKMAGFYEDMVVKSGVQLSDITRAIQNAFAEASWPSEMRADRYVTFQSQPQTQRKEHSDKTENFFMRFWVLHLDLNDPLNRAVAIAPWDAPQAIKLIDEAIGLNDDRKRNVCNGEGGCLPLWDLRKIEVCHRLLCKQNSMVMVLGMERLQTVFDLRELHEGGNFTGETVEWLTQAIVDGNLCAQTTLGLLLAGDGEYWDIARNWARCNKSPEQGVNMLYVAARNGDREACTALSHKWAQHEMTKRAEILNRNHDNSHGNKKRQRSPNIDPFNAENIEENINVVKDIEKDSTFEKGSTDEKFLGVQDYDFDMKKQRSILKFDFNQLVALFRTALESQNANAILNLGVLWKHGIEGIVQADRAVALDCFLMALQGTCLQVTRNMAAVHLVECYNESGEEQSIVATLTSFWSNNEQEKNARALHDAEPLDAVRNGRPLTNL